LSRIVFELLIGSTGGSLKIHVKQIPIKLCLILATARIVADDGLILAQWLLFVLVPGTRAGGFVLGLVRGGVDVAKDVAIPRVDHDATPGD
jgi:hypothetical protein